MSKKTVSFHSFWQNKVKESTKASFVSWETTGDKLRLKIVKDGQPNYFILDGSFENVDENTYISLLESLVIE
jgi:hypothetical protein